MNARSRPLRLGAIILGALVFTARAAPGALIGSAAVVEAARPATAAATLLVQHIACEACATKVRGALQKLDGVRNVKVSVPKKQVVVEYEPSKVSPATLVDAVSKAGFPATLR